jgi:hypothetical protein
LLLGVVVVGLRNLNLLPTTFFSFYAIQIGSAMEMVLLSSFALAERINDLQREKDAAQQRGPHHPAGTGRDAATLRDRPRAPGRGAHRRAGGA